MSEENKADRNETVGVNDNTPSNYDRRYDNNMADQDYGYQNFAGPAPQATYRTNYSNPQTNYSNPQTNYNPVQGNYRGNYGGNYRGNYAQPGMRGNAGTYFYNTPGYARPYGDNYEHNYEHNYHHDNHHDYDNHYEHEYYEHGPYYNRPPGMGMNRMNPRNYNYGPYYNRPPGMERNWMHHQYYHGQPYFDGYGMDGQGPWGFVRNWFAFNPVTNWVRSPRGSNFLRGLGIATAGIILAPAVVKTLRPLAVQAVHGVMSIAGEVKGVVADAREELEDIFADSKWENLTDREQKIQEGE